jgi:RimJ/RimL family protein N-acetyltransferase
MFHFDHYTIRFAKPGDLSAYFALIERNRPRLEDFFAGTAALTHTLEDTETHLSDVLAKQEEKKFYPFLVIDDSNGALIASIQIKNLDWSIPKGEIGYYIDAAYEGKGIITKATSRVISYGFEQLGLAKMYIRTHERNAASLKVAQKNGFIYEGTIRMDYKTTSGEVVDIMYYGMVREEYNAMRSEP